MHSVTILSALLAIGTGVVSAAPTTTASSTTSAVTCTKDIKITEATPIINCDVVDADVTVDPGLSGSLSIQRATEFRKDFTVSNATGLLAISSNSLTTVGGTMRLEGLQLLSSLDMQALTSVDSLQLINLQQLSGLTFGTSGVTKCSSITITDTFMSDLSGLNIATADTIDISNNAKLTTFHSDLVNVTKSLKLTNNGNTMQVNMSRLETAGDVQFRQVRSFDAPALTKVESIKFNDSPELLSVSANNLTDIAASLTFINNKKLANVSFTALTTIKGDMTIQNNTALPAIEGFPKLKTVGNILLAGTFDKVKLDSLQDVQGSVTVTSTTDISSFCKFFDDAKKNNNIRGKESCTSNNKDANPGSNSTGNSTGGSGGSDKKDNAAGFMSINVAMLSLAVLAGMAQLL